MLNRREMRVRTRAPAIISPDAEPMTCAVRDLSERGARLRLRRGTSVPDRFEILFPETGPAAWRSCGGQTDQRSASSSPREPLVRSCLRSSWACLSWVSRARSTCRPFWRRVDRSWLASSARSRHLGQCTTSRRSRLG
ncbi:PilZ domain-containing protein [Micromonospora sp. STR1s_5]|nr:PilZ domain-containing protein [Micromonospora sp. STR1s_5]